MADFRNKVAMVALGAAALGGVVVMPGVANAEGPWVLLQSCTQHDADVSVWVEGLDENGRWQRTNTGLLSDKNKKCGTWPEHWQVNQTVTIHYFNGGNTSNWATMGCIIQNNVATGSTRRCTTPGGPS